jgi:hypothetical protein
MRTIFFCIAIVMCCQTMFPLKLDRVIVATNDNPDYLQFWPIVAKAWREIVGVKPTLALIGDASVSVDESLGDVIRFAPIDGVKTSSYAQCIRLLLPCLFPDDVCILSDIDMIPLQKKFFVENVRNVSDDCFVIYKDKAYPGHKPRVYMCYNAAKGKIFQDLFGVTSYEQIPAKIIEWTLLEWGFATDEKVLYCALKEWNKNKTHIKKLGYTRQKRKRIDRKNALYFKEKKLRTGYYVEINCPRPYETHKVKINHIVQLALLAKK